MSIYFCPVGVQRPYFSLIFRFPKLTVLRSDGISPDIVQENYRAPMSITLIKVKETEFLDRSFNTDMLRGVPLGEISVFMGGNSVGKTSVPYALLRGAKTERRRAEIINAWYGREVYRL